MTMRRRTRRLSLAIGIALAEVLIGGSAVAQEAPTVIGGEKQHETFTLENVHASADFLYRHTDDKIDSPNLPTDKFRQDHFEETLTLNATGSIYHPNLVDLSLGGTFGPTQDIIDSNGQDESFYSFLYDYDVSATILRKEIAPLTLYSRRNEQLINREFGPSLEDTIQTTGAIWDIRSKTIPTRFEVFHSDQKQSGFASDIGEFDLSQNTFLWHSEARPSKNQIFTWDYQFNQIDQSTKGVGSESFNIHDATLTHSIDFGDKDKSNLLSSINYFNQSGSEGIDRLHWNELLRLHHTDDFQTHYSYTLDRQSYLGVDQLLQRGAVGFTHQLFDSLTTNGEVGIQSIERSEGGGDVLEEFASLNFSYVKKVPLGTLHAFTGFFFDKSDNTAQTVVTQVNDVSGTFTDPLPIVITGPNVIPGSVRITDPSGIIVYTPGLDFNVSPFSNRIEIDRIVGGRIGSGDNVLIDYQLSPQAENTTTTTNFSIGGRYEIERGPLRGVSPYVRYIHQNQDVESSSPQSFTPNSYDDLLFGVEYRIWDFTFGAERQMHDSTIDPFDANRFFGRYAHRVSTDTSFNLNVSYTQIQYQVEHNEVDFILVSAQVQHRLTRNLYGTATVVWQNQEDDLRGTTRGLEEQFQLQWRHRQTSVYVQFRNANLQTEGQDRNFQLIEFGLRREF